ncbi:MAG TPA: SBBP repeat-containing protein [Bacteroidia bacterium]|nr:SBBP repeat-containing protein [Bacteroidia bacterium]HRH08832.1 SBBP repeat-containing protein [Bacteroidia bacterium]
MRELLNHPIPFTMKVKRYFRMLLFCLIVSFGKQSFAEIPELKWVKGIGNEAIGFNVTSDNFGNIYIVGHVGWGNDFDPSILNSFLYGEEGDNFLAKYDISGNFLWARRLGSLRLDEGYDVAVDKNSNVYITGFFQYNLSSTVYSSGNEDIFLAKYDTNGNLIWLNHMGGADWDIGTSLDVDSSGNIFVSGSFDGPADFDPSTGTSILNGTVNGFLAKYDTNGTLIWAKKIGESSSIFAQTQCSAISIDIEGNLIITGLFGDTMDFDPSSNVANLISNGDADIFLAKYDNNGNYLWAIQIGDTGYALGCSLATDFYKNIYLAGYYNGITDFDPSPDTACLNSANGRNFIAKYDTIGNYIWANPLNSGGNALNIDLVVDSVGNIFTSGLFSDTVDIDPSTAINNLISKGSVDFYLAEYDSDGNYKRAFSIGGPSYEDIYGLALDNSKNVILTGTSWGAVDFDPSINSTPLTGGRNMFLAKYSLCNSSSFQTVTVCNSYLSQSGNYTWVSSGTYFDTIPNAAGCDSIITINLTINQSTNSSQIITACNNFISPSGIYNWTSSGTYTDTIPNAAGCDSVITINLTINTLSSSSSQTIAACNNFISPSGIYNWTSSGTYTDTIPNAAGCDSVITINLTINTLSSSSTQTITACNNYISPSGIYNWTSSGIYQDTILNSAACDSIITFNLTINNSSYSTQTVAACHYYISPSGNFIWSASGSYLDTIPNLAGCDSIITTQLSINDNESTLNQTGCDSIIVNAQKYTQSGVYTQVLTNSAGCDSVLNLNLTIINSKDSTLTQTACDSLVVNGQKYISSGTYLQTLTNAFGCDSVLTLILTINNSSDSTLTEITCSEFTLNGITYNSSGVYTQTLTTTSGCDSILTLNLTLNSTSNILSQTACDSIIINGQKYVSSGVYAQTFTNAAGCDSLLTLNLTINQGTILNSTTSACHSYFTNGTTFTQSGLYHLPFMNAFGCASVFNLNLTIFHADTAVTQNSNILSANATSGSYQWIDCNNGNLAIAGATFNSYTATTNGTFAVIVTQNLCADTSSCYLVAGLGINENVSNTSIAIFPNPAKNEFSISSISTIIEIDIYNFLGEKIYTLYTNKKYENVNCKDFASGIYFLQITTSLGIENRKLLIEK